ncbi:hypothetical protein JD844_031239 [Phrynosoma platyrhinos]|uniref:RCK N-terminal domain-containing protein n=1 Tax=Phrynosoma platyrhinos TaxID=52577 RepID=A0ABQ7T0E6_PHRPL|nr:hypothetical protein JD844_031239 [Phrynosoma platyrhinos]
MVMSHLRDHIVVCVLGDPTSTPIGLRNFVMPLRASNFSLKELKEIVFLGSLEYLQREWESIQNFPKLYVLKGTALSCSDLKSVNIKQCCMCAIISAYARGGPGDQTLVDTKSILATLNIRSMQIKLTTSTLSTIENQSASSKSKKKKKGKGKHEKGKDKEVVGGETLNQSQHFTYKRIPVITELSWKILETTGNLAVFDVPDSLKRFLSLEHNHTNLLSYLEKLMQPCCLHVTELLFLFVFYYLTEIASNAQFFQQIGADEFDYMDYSETMSRGAIFSDSFLDSLLCTTYHNHHVLALLQTLVTGGTSPELEEFLAEETQLSGSSTNVIPPDLRNRCKLSLLPLTDNKVSIEGLVVYFGDVFTSALAKFGILCFAIYRLKREPNPYELRKV